MAQNQLNVKLGLNTVAFGKALKNAERSLFRASQRFTDIGGTLTAGITAPLLALGGASLKAAGDIEALKLGLEAVLPAGADATAELQRLRKIAELPGLGFEQAIRGSVRLQAVGFNADQAAASLEAFGRVVAVTGGTADELDSVVRQITQINSKGKILAEDLQVIQENAPAIGLALQEAFGTTNIEAIRETGISAQEFTARLIEGINNVEAFQKVQGGLKNAIENIGIAFRIFFSDIGSEINSIFNAQGAAEQLAAALGRVGDAFRALSDEQKRSIVVILGVAAAIGPVLFAFGKVLTVLRTVPVILGAILPLLTSLSSGFVIAGRAVFALTVGGKGLAGVLAVLQGSFLATIAPIVAIGAAIAAVVGAILFVRRNMEAFAPFFQNIWALINRVLGPIINPILVLIRTIGSAIFGLGEDTASFAGFFSRLWNGIKRTVVSALSAIGSGLRRLAEFAGIDTSKLESFSEFIAGIKQEAAELSPTLTNAVSGVRSLFSAATGGGGEVSPISTGLTGDEFKEFTSAAQGAAGEAGKVGAAVQELTPEPIDALSQATASLSLNFAALTQAAENALTSNLGENAFAGLRAGAGQAELELSNLREQFRQFDEVAAAFGQTEGAQNQLDLLRQKIEATRDAIKTAAVEFGASTEPVQVLQGELGTLTEQYALLGEQLDAQTEKQAFLSETVGQLTQRVQQGLTNAFEGLFTTLVEGGKNAFSNFAKSLGDALKKIVIELLKTIATAAVLASILTLVTGGGASFATIFRGFISGGGRNLLQGIPGLAEGGIVPPGYGNDNYLARLTSQEAIIPLDRLQAMIDQPSGRMVAETVIRGEDIYLAYNRTNKNRGR